MTTASDLSTRSSEPVAAAPVTAPATAPAPVFVPDTGHSREPETAALDVAARYHASWSRPNGVAVPAMGAFYSDDAEKRAFAKRWPLRARTMRPDGTAVSCTPSTCPMSGIVDWYARSYERRATSSGAAEFNMVLDRVSGRIVAETGKVLHNDR